MRRSDFFKIESPRFRIKVAKYQFPRNGIGLNNKLNNIAVKCYWI